MPPRARPFEQFGPYILFKRLENSVLGDLWRAARLDGETLGSLVALRRFSIGNRDALAAAASDAAQVLPLLTGTTFVKAQTAEVVEGIPCLVFEYGGGRSLRHIVDRARGTNGVAPNPIPVDQAVLIAERIALSLATTAEMKRDGARLSHGALIPHLVWISDDGEVRLAGQQLGKGLIASLDDAKVYAEIGAYFAPERRTSATARTDDVYALGAILFLLVTGNEPPDPLSISAFTHAVRAAKTMSGQPVPLDIRTILDKSLTLDAAARYPSIADMKQALDSVANKYAATTFNLAFYISTLLKKELEAESIDREKENRVNAAAYTAAAEPAPPVEMPIAIAAPARRRAPMVLAAAIALVAIGAAAVVFMTQSKAAPNTAPAAPLQQRVAVPAPAPAIVTPPASAEAAVPDPDAAKKAFEEAVNRKLQEEMLKLQANFDRDLPRSKPKPAEVAAEPVAVPVAPAAQPAEERAPSAAAFDARRTAVKPEAPAPALAVQAPVPVVAAPEPQPATAAAISEGDLVDLAQLDAAPRPQRQPAVQYPAMAIRQKAEASVIVTMLVSETGDVLDVRVLRGDARFGFNDAAIRAVRAMKFSPAMKDGKRVKTWFPQTIYFRL